MKAHDVRQLRACRSCGNMGDQREMISHDGGLWHGKCIFEEIGLKGISSLPASEIAKFRLEQIGAKAMKHLVNLEPAK